MSEPIDTQLAATEHCQALPQCNDDGCHCRLGEPCLGLQATHSRLDLWLVLLASALLALQRAQRKQRDYSEETTIQLNLEAGKKKKSAENLDFELHSRPQLRLPLRKKPMGEGESSQRREGLGLTLLVFTLVSRPVCKSGMNRKRVAFTVCITLDFPYRVMSLHQTISTAIRAVDDNQVSNCIEIQRSKSLRCHCRRAVITFLPPVSSIIWRR
jgi:hypothetical protein